MNYSIIQKSQLEGTLRIDAEHYQPVYLEIKEIMTQAAAKPLKELLARQVVTGKTPKQRDCLEDDTDIKFIKTDTVRQGEIIFDLADCLPVKQSSKHSEPHAGDILVTIIGADYEIVGRSAMVFAGDPKMNINQNIALIRPDKNLISPAISHE